MPKPPYINEIFKRRDTKIVLARMRVPYRSYQNFADFLKTSRYHWDRTDAFPCTACSGDGWNYDPDDAPCPVEGNKMRRRLACQVCAGTTIGPREPLMKEYQRIVAQYRAELAQHRRDVHTFTRLAAQMTDEELEIVSRFLHGDIYGMYCSNVKEKITYV